MAPFNTFIPTKEENYLGYSKGVDAPKPNMTLAKLFSGMGDLLDEGLKGADQVMEIKATEAAKQATKPLTEEVNNLSLEDAATLGQLKNKLGIRGGTEGTDNTDSPGLIPTGSKAGAETPEGAAGEGDKPLPPVAQRELSELDKWAQRYANGQLSPTYLHLREQKTIQQLSQRYPGYAEKIKQTVQGELHTANQIQNQIFQDFQAAAAASRAAQDKWITEAKGYEKELGVEGMQFAKQAINNPDMQWSIREFVAGKRQSEHLQAQEKSALELKAAQRNANVDDYKNHASSIGSSIVANAASGVLFGSKQMGLQSVQEAINKLYTTPGGQIDPDKKQALTAQLQEISTFTRNQIYNELYSQTRTDPSDPSKKTSIANIITPKVANDTIEELMAPFNQASKFLNGDNPSLAAGQLQLLNITKQNQALKTLSVPFFKIYSGLNETVGGQVAGQILGLEYKKTEGTVMNDALKALKQIQDGTTAIQGGSGLNTNRTQMDQVDPKASLNDRATFLRGRIEFMQKMFRDPKVTPEMKVNAAKELSVADTHAFIVAFKKDEQVNVWGQVAAPDISKGVKEASNSDPKIWDNYKDWNTNTFKVLFQDQVDLLRQKSAAGTLTDIQYNPNTNMVEYTQAPPPMTGLGGRPVSRFPIGREEIDKLNSGLRTINGVLSQDKDTTTIPKMLKDMNFPVAPTAGGKRSEIEGGTFQQASAPPVVPLNALSFAPVENAHPEAIQAISTALNHAERALGVGKAQDAAAFMPKESLQGKSVAPMDLAKQFLGAHERSDRIVLSQFISEAAGKRLDPVKTAWCAAFINAALHEVGMQGSGSLAARSFLNFGTPTNEPKKGDIVVLSRGRDTSKGHVGFFDSITENGKVRVLGGNQHDSVSYAEFPRSNVLGFRRPTGKAIANAQ